MAKGRNKKRNKAIRRNQAKGLKTNFINYKKGGVNRLLVNRAKRYVAFNNNLKLALNNRIKNISRLTVPKYINDLARGANITTANPNQLLNSIRKLGLRNFGTNLGGGYLNKSVLRSAALSIYLDDYLERFLDTNLQQNDEFDVDSKEAREKYFNDEIAPKIRASFTV